MRRIFFRLRRLVRGRDGWNVPKRHISELSLEAQGTVVLRQVFKEGRTTVSNAAHKHAVEQTEAIRLLETLFDDGWLVKYMHRGVLYYSLK